MFGNPFEAIASWDPYTPLDLARDLAGEAGSTVRTGIETSGEVGVAVSEQIPAAARNTAAAAGFFGALGAATIPITATAAGLVLYVVFVDPALPGRMLRKIKG